MDYNKGTSFFKKSKGTQSRIGEPQVETSRQLKFSDSPFNPSIKFEISGEPAINLELERSPIKENMTPFSSSRKLLFDLEQDKENIDPIQTNRNKLNNLMVPKNTKEEATSFLDILSLRRNYTDAPIEEERPQNSETTEICFFSQPESLRKGSLTDFASFKFTKLKSDHSDRSSGNMEVFCSQGLPTFEDSKPFQISFANSQPNPGSEDENLESKYDSRDVDSTKETSDCNTSDIPEPYIPLLTTVKNLKNPDLLHITPETLCQLDASNKPYLIVDCRYDYEYQGGHIQGAINIRCPELLERVFFTNRQLLHNSKYLMSLKLDFESVMEELQGFDEYSNSYPGDQETPIIIFHCEFSQKRGPRALRALRNMDRELNQHRWPAIFYPEVYILEGGYRNFCGTYGDNCVPKNGYVEMIDKNMKKEYMVNRNFETKHWKKKNCYNLGGSSLPGLHRSKTICEF